MDKRKVEQISILIEEENGIELLDEKEEVVALKILSILNGSDISVIGATNTLNFCLEAVQFSKVQFN